VTLDKLALDGRLKHGEFALQRFLVYRREDRAGRLDRM
jgi:hypothetical protein